MSEGTEEQWVAACRAGNLESYDRLIGLYYRQVFAVCLGILGHTADAEDAAQETFIKGLQQIGQLPTAGQFGSWITRIARNSCIDLIRKGQRFRRALEKGLPPVPEERRNTLDLERAIQRLPVELRAPLVMFYLDGQRIDSVAQSLEISPRTADQRLGQARKELHRLLTEEGDE